MTRHGASAELYIDRGRGSEAENELIFDGLAAHKGEIEDSYGGALSWERLEGRRACCIAQRFEDGGYTDEERWPEIHERLVDAMVRLERALRPWLRELPV